MISFAALSIILAFKRRYTSWIIFWFAWPTSLHGNLIRRARSYSWWNWWAHTSATQSPSRFDGRCTAYHFARGCRCAWLDAPAHVCAKIPPNGDDTKGRSPVASLSRWCTFPAVIPGMAPAHLWAVAAGEPAGWCLGHGNLRLIVDQFHGLCDVNDI